MLYTLHIWSTNLANIQPLWAAFCGVFLWAAAPPFDALYDKECYAPFGFGLRLLETDRRNCSLLPMTDDNLKRRAVLVMACHASNKVWVQIKLWQRNILTERKVDQKGKMEGGG